MIKTQQSTKEGEKKLRLYKLLQQQMKFKNKVETNKNTEKIEI